MTEGTPRTIVLIHGLWLTSLSWQHWITRYTERGETVIAPEWPRMNADLETLRRDPSVMNGLGLTEIVDSYDRKIRDLDTPPILIGHSFGGTIVQLLLDRGLGAAGVAIDPAPIKGVLRLPLSALRASAPALTNPLNRNKTVGLSKEQWHFAFTNTLSKADSDALYDEYHVPSTARLLYQAATANFKPNAATKVNFKNETRAPLLIIAGGADHTVPPAMTKENYQRYKSNAVTDYYEFPGRPHFTGGVPGWEEVADYALDWALKHS